jgi:hypothetical protein
MAQTCYCELWKTNPRQLEEQGIPPGFCGICQSCGKPGHTQAFPGPMPVTGAWCDHCVRIARWTNPALWIQIIFGTLLVAGIIWNIWKVFGS